MTLEIAKQTAQQGNHLNCWLSVTFRRKTIESAQEQAEPYEQAEKTDHKQYKLNKNQLRTEHMSRCQEKVKHFK
jgi:hypothetical protein